MTDRHRTLVSAPRVRPASTSCVRRSLGVTLFARAVPRIGSAMEQNGPRRLVTGARLAVRGMATIARADVATCMLDAIDNAATVHRRLIVATAPPREP